MLKRFLYTGFPIQIVKLTRMRKPAMSCRVLNSKAADLKMVFKERKKTTERGGKVHESLYKLTNEDLKEGTRQHQQSTVKQTTLYVSICLYVSVIGISVCVYVHILASYR